MKDTDRLNTAFDQLDADIDQLIVRYRRVKAERDELLAAAKRVVAETAVDLPPTLSAIELCKDLIRKCEQS